MGHSSERTGAAPAASLLERAGWLEKLPLTIICGILLGFSAAPYGVWWLAWIGIAPLILLVFGSRSRMDATLTGLVFGIAYHMVALRWLFDLHPLDWFGIQGALSIIVSAQVWFMESLHQALLTALFAMFLYSLPMRAGILPHWSRPFFPFLLSAPLIWIFLQWVVAPSPMFLGVPIDQLAYSQARVPELIQVARFGGAQSVDFLIIIFNCAVAALLTDLTGLSRSLPSRADVLSDRLGAFFDLAFVAGVCIALANWGQNEVYRDAAMPQYWQYDKNSKPNAKGYPDFAPAIPVAVVQGGLPIEKSVKASAADIATQYLPLVKDLGAPIVVLPSGVESLRGELQKIASTQLKDVVIGARQLSDEPGTTVGAAPTQQYADQVQVLSADGHREPAYTKYRLVPFAEYTPLGPLGALVPNNLQQRLRGGRTPIRPTALPIPKTAFGRFGGSLGVEMIYPDLIVSEVNRGASLLINVSDLSYFHGAMLGQELVAAAALRAVENGRYVVMASNTGISAVIDPHGVVTSASLAAKSGVLFDRVQFLHRRTPFTRMCLWTPLYR